MENSSSTLDPNQNRSFTWNFLSTTNDTSTGDPEFHRREGNVATTSSDASYLPWDNPDNLMTLEQYLLTAKITNCVLSPLLLAVGGPTNIISALIFYKQGLKDRMNLCLFVLAIIDTTFLVSSFVVCLNSYIALWDIEMSRKYYAETLVHFGWVMFGSKAVSGCISMVVAVERCVCVVFPLRANSIMRTRTMGALLVVIIIIVYLLAAIFNITYRSTKVVDKVTGEVHYVLVVTDFIQRNRLFYDILYDILLSFSLPLLNIVVIALATAITVIKLHSAMAWRASTSSGRADNHSQQQQAALTKMLVILSCVFLACSAPLTGMSVARLLVPDYSLYGRYSNFFYASHIVAVHFITPLNSAVNFFVYYSRSSRFRQELHAMCCCRLRARGESNGSAAFCVKGDLPTSQSELD